MLSSLFCYLWLQQQPIENPASARYAAAARRGAARRGRAARNAPAATADRRIGSARNGGAPSLPDAPPPSAPPPPPAATAEAGAAAAHNVRAPGLEPAQPGAVADPRRHLRLLRAGTPATSPRSASRSPATIPPTTTEGFGLQEMEIAAHGRHRSLPRWGGLPDHPQPRRDRGRGGVPGDDQPAGETCRSRRARFGRRSAATTPSTSTCRTSRAGR